MYDGTILKWSIFDIIENDAERHVSFKFINNEPTAIQSPQSSKEALLTTVSTPLTADM